MINSREIPFSKRKALALQDFKEMDYYAVEKYSLSIELMMENAGLSLAKIIAHTASKDDTILIGIGNGNNGGGGLVASRRLAAWGYKVYLDTAFKISKELPSLQLKRALSFGVKTEAISNPNLWVDGYLGFSQRLPLNDTLLTRIKEANSSKAKKISLDIPTGFLGDTSKPYFEANRVVTLAYPKKILFELDSGVEIFVADLGIPHQVYKKFNVDTLPFDGYEIIKLNRVYHD